MGGRKQRARWLNVDCFLTVLVETDYGKAATLVESTSTGSLKTVQIPWTLPHAQTHTQQPLVTHTLSMLSVAAGKIYCTWAAAAAESFTPLHTYTHTHAHVYKHTTHTCATNPGTLCRVFTL